MGSVKLPLPHVVIDLEVVCIALCIPELSSIYQLSPDLQEPMEYGSMKLPLLEPKRGQALLCIRARLLGQICQHLRQQKKRFTMDIYSGAQAVDESL